MKEWLTRESEKLSGSRKADVQNPIVILTGPRSVAAAIWEGAPR
jgi:hypothetical protein